VRRSSRDSILACQFSFLTLSVPQEMMLEKFGGLFVRDGGPTDYFGQLSETIRL